MEAQPIQVPDTSSPKGQHLPDGGTGDMGRFMRKVGLRLLILAVIWIIFTQLLPRRLYLGAEYARWEAVFAKVAEMQKDKKPVNVILGDSKPEMGLAGMTLRAWNLALGGTSPVEGFYILDLLREVPIDTVYLSYAPFHIQSQDCFHNRTEYFGFVDPVYIDSVMALGHRQGDTTYAWNNWVWLDDLQKNFTSPWVRRQLRHLPAMHGIDNYSWYFQGYAAMQTRLQQDQLSYLFPSDICPRDTSIQEYYLEQKAGGFFPNGVNAHYFSLLLKEIGRRKLTLVWINMPFNNAIRQPTQKYYADFEAWLRPQLPPDAPYYPMSFQDSCDFKDFSHLDAEAANRFGLNFATWLRSSEGP